MAGKVSARDDASAHVTGSVGRQTGECLLLTRTKPIVFGVARRRGSREDPEFGRFLSARMTFASLFSINRPFKSARPVRDAGRVTILTSMLSPRRRSTSVSTDRHRGPRIAIAALSLLATAALAIVPAASAAPASPSPGPRRQRVRERQRERRRRLRRGAARRGRLPDQPAAHKSASAGAAGLAPARPLGPGLDERDGLERRVQPRHELRRTDQRGRLRVALGRREHRHRVRRLPPASCTPGWPAPGTARTSSTRPTATSAPASATAR